MRKALALMWRINWRMKGLQRHTGVCLKKSERMRVVHNGEGGQNLGYICEIKMHKIGNQLDWKEKKK